MTAVTATARGVLVVAGTPIGDVGDASPRLAEALAQADVIAAEDTRRFGRLRAALEVETDARVVSYFEANEERRTDELLHALRDGARVVLLTDAGMPGVSDPGYRLVAAAVESGVAVTAIPGPSAVTTALAVSGLPSDRYCFEGFLPRRDGERRRLLRELAGEGRTLVFFESPRRLAATLSAMADVMGADRRAAVCRELTKTHEEIRRGTVGELAAWATGGVLGEVTVVLAGAEAPVAAPDEAALARAVTDQMASGESRRTAVDKVAARFGVPRRTVYAAATRKTDGGPSLG
jgi:16S rRNA (cytidine1402-2'-O)-methyltransferase